MVRKIDTDVSRFKKIVKGQIKKDLRKYIKQGEMIGRQGKDLVSIPMPEIEIPRFKFDFSKGKGVGQGEGEAGDTIGQGEQQDGKGEAGENPGEHGLEVDISLDELAEILGEELELPKIEPKGSKKIESVKDRYVGIRNVGPESLRHFKRTYKKALKRMISSGVYDEKNPVVIPIREDKVYRSWVEKEVEQNNAVVIYIMDVSGSMGEEQKEIVRIESFWIDTWLRSQYKGLETRYIIHDSSAREVDKDTFFRTRESGGTKISSAYELCMKIIEKDYDFAEWNVYPFHFSDGDNWAGDTERCVEILSQNLIPRCNIFCYGQVESLYGSGKFIQTLRENFTEEEDVITSVIGSKEDIYRSIKDFLGKGK
ncbi:DUF444 family protein [bacterium]|nr:DUF444 family protein [bacterium]